MLKIVRILASVGAFASLSSATSAQPAVRGMAACRVDVATFCQGIEAGRGKRVACLTVNQDKLSPECRTIVQLRAAKAPESASPSVPGAAPPAATRALPPPPSTGAASPPAATATPGTPPPLEAAAPAVASKGGRFAACRADMQSLCAGAQVGGGGRMRCLQDNQAKLSPACAETLAQLQGQKQDARLACATDANRLCPGLKGEPRRACFSANQAQLLPECAALVAKRASAGGAQKQ